MKLNFFYLSVGAFTLFILLGHVEVRHLTSSLIILFSTALAVQMVIDVFLKLWFLRGKRDAISRLFARLPMALGFATLVFIGVTAVLVEMILLRKFVSPSDSWLLITLGFLLGVMGPVLHCKYSGRKNRDMPPADW